MNLDREQFIRCLRQAMAGAPPELVDSALADFAAHFDEGRAAGRGDTEIAAALGDPALLGEQLRLEADVAAWESSRSSKSGFRLVIAGLRRAALAVVTPFVAILVAVVAALIVIAVLTMFVVGAWLLVQGDALGLPGGGRTALLAGLGLIFGALSLAAAIALAVISLINRLAVRLRHRLHTRSSLGVQS